LKRFCWELIHRKERKDFHFCIYIPQGARSFAFFAFSKKTKIIASLAVKARKSISVNTIFFFGLWQKSKISPL
jgi:hypothetical protein